MKIEFTTEQHERKAIEAEVDLEVGDFEEWFRTLGNTGGLARVEIAILKTYIGWKLGVYKKGS